MKYFSLFIGLLLLTSQAFAVSWGYQVNIDTNIGKVNSIKSSKTSFDAGPYPCQVTQTSTKNDTEFRTLVCAVGAETVSTGALCTKKGAKFPSVQYAILNINGPKSLVNVVVSCK